MLVLSAHITLGESLAHGLIKFEEPHNHIIATIECLYVDATAFWRFIMSDYTPNSTMSDIKPQAYLSSSLQDRREKS